MKLIKMLDEKGSNLISDPLNQTLLKNLVLSDYSVSELAEKLNMPTLKLWRRMQKLLKANLIELIRTEKVGNLEKKIYRASATGYIPQQQFLEFKPKDNSLKEAFEIYTNIQMEITKQISVLGEIPKDVDPVDFALFASMHAFSQVFTKTTTQHKLVTLQAKIDNYKNFILTQQTNTGE
jgi:hypothetical protein